MSVTRISDTIVQNLPNTILSYIKSDKTNTLDTSIFDAASFKMRDIIDRIFPVMGIVDLADISQELDKYSANSLSLLDKQLLVSVVKEALDKSASIAKPISSSNLEEQLSKLLSSSNSIIESTQKVKQLFSKAYYLTDSNTIRPGAYIFVAPNFNGIVTQLTARVNSILKAKGTELRLGKYLDLGHSAASIHGTNEFAFNSPKLISALFDIATSTSSQFVSKTINLNTATQIFSESTGQLEYSVEVSRDFGKGFLNLFISIGGSIVTYENAVENQMRGSLEAKEKFGTNKHTLAKLAAKFKSIQETGIKGLFNPSDLAKIVRSTIRSSGSPSMLDHAIHQIARALSGEAVEQHKSSVKGAPLKKKFTVISANPKLGTKAKSLSIKAKGTAVESTQSLEALLKLRIRQQVEQNMGKGSATNVLNYRTGRFANSVTIDRITTSRQGMISVFYDYMRYPYATFSQGGAQQNPKTRDPKLLISKSIREIGQSLAYTRMRAVLV